MNVERDGPLPFQEMLPTLKNVAAAFRDAGLPFVVAGGVSSWAHGGPETDHDLDVLVKPADAERALRVLADLGLRSDRPPEPWLYKAFDGDVLVDVIFAPAGVEVTDALIERSPVVDVFSVPMRVLRPEDLLVTKLMAMTEHTMDYRSCLEIARALREQIDWTELRGRTLESPFADAFFTLVDGLGIAPERPGQERRDMANVPRRLPKSRAVPLKAVEPSDSSSSTSPRRGDR